MSKRGPSKPRPWQEMQRATPVHPESFYANEGPNATMWINDRYVVVAAPYDQDDSTFDGMVWLSIRRSDRKAMRDWRHFQWIKNDIVGTEREAFELFPRESRLVDTVNQYHLFVLPTGKDLEVGWNMGRVVSTNGVTTVDGRVLTPDEIGAQLLELGRSHEDLDKTRQRALDP